MILGDRPTVIANARLTGAERLDPFGDDLVDVHLAGGVIADTYRLRGAATAIDAAALGCASIR